MKLRAIDYYILLWAFFHVGRFYGIGGIIYLLPVLLIWSLYDMVLLHSKYKISRFVAIYDVMVVMFMVYGVIMLLGFNSIVTAKSSEIKNTDYLVKVLQSLLPFYTLYRNALSGKYTITRINSWTVIFIIVVIFDYSMQLRNAYLLHLEADEVVNNGAYLVLGLLPVICLLKRKTTQIVLIVVSLYYILTAFKRGPILIAIICIVYYVYFVFHFSKKRTWIFVLITIAIVFSYQYFMNFIMTSDLFQARLILTEEGYSSGRDIIVSSLLDAFVNSNFLNLIFGYGAYGTVLLIGRLAHNDWIQILIDQGVMGVVIHALFCWQLLLQWKRTPKEDNAKLALGIFVFIYLLTTFFSMAFDRIPLYEMVVLSYCVARNDLNKVVTGKNNLIK